MRQPQGIARMKHAELQLVKAVIGRDHRIDPDVLIGYPTGRKVEHLQVVIGRDAVMAGNGKDDARELLGLLNGLESGYDFVQGSRYLKGGVWENMPLHRVIGTKAYSFLFSVLNRLWITDATNGFRAYRSSLFDDKRINIWQDWLTNYEVESYLFSKSIRMGYRVREVPVSKIYPPSLALGYTKMKPFVDWWRHFRPSLLLALYLKS